MLKIILTGPESSGKTTLATLMARRWDCPLVPEVARQYLEALGRPYVASDLPYIARAQQDEEDQRALQAADTLVCDTDVFTIYIWALYKYGHCDEALEKMVRELDSRIYFLCLPDVPWEADPLRENPNDRHQLFAFYQKELDRLGRRYIVISGSVEQRLGFTEHLLR